jgi:hypothetical protein
MILDGLAGNPETSGFESHELSSRYQARPQSPQLFQRGDDWSVTMLEPLEIEISPTADGKDVYVQIRSVGTAMPVNIVLIAQEVVVRDTRDGPPR